MNYNWYELVPPDASLAQGDIVLDCPIVAWGDAEITPDVKEPDQLMGLQVLQVQDVIVMTQACDLANGKVTEVTLCAHRTLPEVRVLWEQQMKELKQNPSPKAWQSWCKRIVGGQEWNLAMLNHGNVNGMDTPHRIVDFHALYVVPRRFLESVVVRRGQPRLRLLPPYREHLSQAFARYFMRVGLPEDVQAEW